MLRTGLGARLTLHKWKDKAMPGRLAPGWRDARSHVGSQNCLFLQDAPAVSQALVQGTARVWEGGWGDGDWGDTGRSPWDFWGGQACWPRSSPGARLAAASHLTFSFLEELPLPLPCCQVPPRGPTRPGHLGPGHPVPCPSWQIRNACVTAKSKLLVAQLGGPAPARRGGKSPWRAAVCPRRAAVCPWRAAVCLWRAGSTGHLNPPGLAGPSAHAPAPVSG